MEEKQEQKQEPELKGKMGIIWLTGILVILLGCVTVYTLNICRKKGMKEPPQPVKPPQSVATTVPQVTKSEETENTITEENKKSTSNTTNIENEYSNKDKEEIKETIENYYKLLSAKENSPVLMLTDVLELTVEEVQDPDYAPSNYVKHPKSNKYSWTGIKYKEFRGELWYISDDLLKKNFPEFVEYKDYLYVEDNNIAKYSFKYTVVKQEIDKNSTESTCICDVTVKNSKTGKQFINRIKMSRGNGNFVIVSVSNK